MKTMVAAAMSLFALSGVFPTRAEGQTMKLAEALVLSVQNLAPGEDPKAFENRVLNETAPAAKSTDPGWQFHLTKKDRGPHAGQYLLAWTGTSKSLSGGLTPIAIPAGNTFQVYQLVGADKLGALPEVDVLAVHFIKVRPDRISAFDKLVVDKLHPAVGNLRPDLRLLYYKPVGGSDPGSYITVFALTKASRDKYWPSGSDSEDLKTAIKAAQALTEELKTYLVEGSYATGNLAAAVYESKDWGDWVVVR
jgi:hypothetical protein